MSPFAKRLLQSGLQFLSVQRISSAMTVSSQQDDDDDDDDEVEMEDILLMSLLAHDDLVFLSLTYDLGKIPVSELQTFLPRYQSEIALVEDLM